MTQLALTSRLPECGLTTYPGWGAHVSYRCAETWKQTVSFPPIPTDKAA